MPALIDYLGLISTAPATPMPGDMVYRSVAGGWTTFNPGTPGQQFIIDPVTGLPTWEDSIVTGLPTAGVAYRGQVLTVAGGGGVADVCYVCLKAAGGSYSWKVLATG